MKKLTAITTSLIILISLFIIFPLLIKLRPDISNESFTNSISLTSQTPINFSFTPIHNQISRLDLQFKNPNLSNTSLVTVTINSTNYEFQTSFTGYNIEDPSWISLQIPLLDSKNSPVSVSIITNNTQKDSLLVTADKNFTPNYRAFYKSSYTSNLNTQLDNLIRRQPLYNFIYIILIVFLNIQYLRSHEISKK